MGIRQLTLSTLGAHNRIPSLCFNPSVLFDNLCDQLFL